MFEIIAKDLSFPSFVILDKGKSTLALLLNVTTPKISFSSKEWIIVLTECLTKSSRLKPSDYFDCP